MDKKELAELYDWLDTAPFSRTKKNLARAFSDSVLAAELIKHFIPAIVDLHNYPPSCKLEQKKTNWSTLNTKVLKKLDFPLSDATISELAASKRDAIEYFLNCLRKKIDSYLQKKHKRAKKEKEMEQVVQDLKLKDNIIECPSHLEGTCHGKDCAKIKQNCANLFKKAWDPRNQFITATVSGEVYDQRVRELLTEKQELVINLKEKIHNLEHLLLHKDQVINDLQNKLNKFYQVAE